MKSNSIEGVFVTDVHITHSSNVRADEDYTGSILKKLEFVISKANEFNCPIFMGGDFCDKPTIPDLVKNRLIDVISKANNPIVSCWGNHDTLFNNWNNDIKTSFGLLSKTGYFISMRTGGFEWEDSEGRKVYVNFTKPMGSHGMPQLGLYHGFLNDNTDKDNKFMFTDIDHDDKSIIFLGHDHVPYEPLAYKNAVIHRPGAMVRAIRNDSEDRIPQLVRFKYNFTKDKWVFQYIDIPCADPSLIFKTKKAKVKRDEESYADIINQIKNAAAEDMSLMKALNLVTTKEVCDYCENILDELNNHRASR